MELQTSAFSITWRLLFVLKFEHHCPFLTLCSGAECQEEEDLVLMGESPGRTVRSPHSLQDMNR